MTYFSLAGYGDSINDAGPLTNNGYADRTGTILPVNLEQGGSYTGYVSYNNICGCYYEYDNEVWIDFNDDGTFSSSEAVTAVFGGNYYTYTSSFTLGVPMSSNLGIHRMRVRTLWTRAAVAVCLHQR